MGRSIAHRFGRERHRVALIARNAAKLDTLVTELTDAGIDAGAFPADVSDRVALRQALIDVKARFGTVDVLEYSPGAS